MIPLTKDSLIGSWWFTDNTFGGLANVFVGKCPNVCSGFVNKKYISKYIRTIKIGAMLKSFFHPALPTRELSIRILLFG
jgi:hypothetical protein